VGHVAYMEGGGGLAVRKPAEKGPHGISWHRWAHNTELNLKRKTMGGGAWTRLTFNRPTGQCCPLKCTPFVPKRENNVVQ